MSNELIQALEAIEAEKGIEKEVILEALEKALVKSYEKNFDDKTNVEIEVDKETGTVNVYSVKTVVEEVEDEDLEISLEDALRKDKEAELGSEIRILVKPKDFGRVAAQTARNIVIQKLRDAERQSIYNEFIEKERELITGEVQRIDFNNIFINLGKTEGFIPPSEQVHGEDIRVGDRLKLFVNEVKNTTKGPQIILSRSNPQLVVRLFEQEIPEIEEGTVEIYSVAREAGSRTKIAVYSKDPDVDCVGACVGYKGTRVNHIVDELNGEKMDIIIWDPDIKQFISNALSPSQVIKVIGNEKEKSAVVIVPDDQLSLAIGKEGQNVRLAAKLTGWKIDIKGKETYDASPEEFDAMEYIYKPGEEEETDEDTEEINEEDLDMTDKKLGMNEELKDGEKIADEMIEEDLQTGGLDTELIDASNINENISVPHEVEDVENENIEK